MSSKGRWSGTITDGLSWANLDLTALTYQVPKRVYTIGQFSRFIRPGSTVLTFTSSDSGLLVTAVQPAAGKAVVVLINSTKSAKTANVMLQNLSSLSSSVVPYRTSATENQAPLSPIAVVGGTVTLSVPAQSIVTLVGN
jgi:glucuronoarabinoxylan endo-1,4-beta-xylanase